jgi:hypothetical protein
VANISEAAARISRRRDSVRSALVNRRLAGSSVAIYVAHHDRSSYGRAGQLTRKTAGLVAWNRNRAKGGKALVPEVDCLERGLGSRAWTW